MFGHRTWLENREEESYIDNLKEKSTWLYKIKCRPSRYNQGISGLLNKVSSFLPIIGITAVANTILSSLIGGKNGEN